MKTDKNIFIAFILNLLFAMFELFGGIITNSVAIISDSIHDVGDAISIGISYFLEKKSKRKPDSNYTYGYLRYSVLGAVITSVILLVGSSLVIINSIRRLFNPVIINYNGMIIFAVLGVLVNYLALYFTKEGNSIGEKAVNLHMLEDVLGWGIVLVGAIVMKFTSISILDSIMSIGVAIFILISSIKNLKTILDLFLEKIPNNISVDEVKKQLLKIKDIKDIHHIHIWSIDGNFNCATMHVVGINMDIKLKEKIRSELSKYDINHVTIEFEDELDSCDEVDCSYDYLKVNNHHHHH